MGNGNVNKLKRDLDLLDIEELKINREMYMLQLKINETSENKKKVRVKKNYLQITERKLKALENKENQNMQLETINNNAENNNNNKNEFQRETNPGKNSGEVIKSEISPKKTSIIIGKLTKFYKVKIAIGIATGSCFTGLITLQGNKKYFSLLGKKANLSRVLSEEAYKVINKNN